MQGKELLRRLKAASWSNKQEAETFARKLTKPTAQDLLRCLETIQHNRTAGTSQAHQLRCVVLTELVKKAPRRQLFTPFVRALKTSDPHLRQTLQKLIPLINSIDGHHELVGYLRSTDATLRQTASQLLIELGGKTVIDTLLTYVQDPSFAGFPEAIEVAVAIGGYRLVPLLGEIVRNGPTESKMEALQHLGDRVLITHNKHSAAKAILPALRMTGDQILEQAIRSYAAMSTEAHYFQHVERYIESGHTRLAAAAIEGLRWFNSPRTIVTLTKQLQASSDRLSRAALSALEVMGDEAILPALVQGLSHTNINVRTRAQQALTYLSENGQIDLTRAVLWLLRSDDVSVRRRAVDLARSIRDPHGEFWPNLLTFLQDEDWWVREQVTDALLELAGRRLTKYIVPYLQANSEIIRRWAIEVLGRIKDPQAVGLLVRLAQQDEDWWVREKAIEALGELGDKRVTPYLLDLMNESPELLLSSLRALAALEATESTTHILPLLHTSPPDVQLAILECLEAFHCIDCAGDVMPLLQAESPEVSRAAFQLLNRWEARAKQQADPFLSLSGSPLDQILIAAHKAQGEDLLLAPNRKAYIKQHGNIQPLSEHIFRAEQLESILIPHLNANQLEQLQNINDIDFSYDVSSHNLRFRAHLFYQHGGLSAVFRHIDSRLASFDKLGLPSQVKTFSKLNHGLVIVGGPTGSGKSTTLAAIINDINRHSNRHIISLEDPIEVLHSSEKSLVNQREIGSHTLSFEKALRSALRQDPDVILVGEMRDLTTISLAITAAETGHLVFGTLHTVSAETTVDRVINAFPAHQQEQIRSMLAQSLKAVVCQYLLKRKDQNGRCLASEVMLNTDAIGNLIRKAKQFQISSVIATSREAGMHLMDHDLMRLYEEGLVYADEVYMKAKNKQDFEKLLAEEEFGQRNRVSSSMSVVVGTALKH